jgi:hypothetical protein
MLICSFGLAHSTRWSEYIEVERARLGDYGCAGSLTLRGLGGGSQWQFQFGDPADGIGKIKVGAEGKVGVFGSAGFSSLLGSHLQRRPIRASACRRAEALRTLSSRQLAGLSAFYTKMDWRRTVSVSINSEGSVEECRPSYWTKDRWQT